MSNNTIDWVTAKLKENDRIETVDRTPENYLNVIYKGGHTALVAVLNVQDVVEQHDVEPLFSDDLKPQLVVNVPSKVLWSGGAIRYIHASSAAFGRFGDISRAASNQGAGYYRDKNMGFFITAMEQHSNVNNVSYVYDNVFTVDRNRGASLTIAVVDAYNMSAEDVRNARTKLGLFDIIVKSTSYGSVTGEAEAAAETMNVEALKFGDLMRRLHK
ncbi:MAG: hypothetical protein KUG81_10115 [Gammaproteobacteria bacterium]|nr:hypothetical protein [Gammaproteobacteria bacterium]